MSEKPAAEKSGAPAEGEAPKKKAPVKLFAIVGVLMVAQAGAIIGVMKATGPKAAEAKPVELDTAHKEDTEATVEIQLVDDRFQNMQSGATWIWDTEIVLQVKARNQAAVEEALEKRGAEIREGIAMIFRRAQHSQLREPGLETINRQVLTFVSGIVGKDGENEPRVKRVLIPKCKGFRAD